MGSEQHPVQDHYNDNEFGLKPPQADEPIETGFSKEFSHNFGWDAINKIWRAMRADKSGNLLIGSGTQSINPPLITPVLIATTATVILNQNTSRKGFAIYNSGGNDSAYAVPIFLQYPSGLPSAFITIPAGYGYYDDNWSGQVSALAITVSTTIYVAEYQ
jgi:hypothetical protein